MQPKLRDQILELIAADVNAKSREDIGREGFTYGIILVLAAVKRGCHFDRGFHSPGNQTELTEIADHVCLPKLGKK